MNWDVSLHRDGDSVTYAREMVKATPSVLPQRGEWSAHQFDTCPLPKRTGAAADRYGTPEEREALLPRRANGSIANLRGQGPRGYAPWRGGCRAYCWTATRDLQPT